MPDAAAWKDRAIYQVLTDRFAVTGHGNNGPACDHKAGRHCGGTWQGIISKLDYIQGMGFDAVWISPVRFVAVKRPLRILANKKTRSLKTSTTSRIGVKHIMAIGKRTSTL